MCMERSNKHTKDHQILRLRIRPPAPPALCTQTFHVSVCVFIFLVPWLSLNVNSWFIMSCCLFSQCQDMLQNVSKQTGQAIAWV